MRAVGGNWSAAGTWELTPGGGESVAVPTSLDDVFFDNAATLTIDATAACKSFNATGCTGTLTHNAFSLTVSGSITFVAGMTYTPVAPTQNLLIMSATGTLTTGGKLLSSFVHTTGTLTLGDNVSFIDDKRCYVELRSTTDLNGKTVSGYSATSRLLIRSQTLGTSKTITVNGGTFANADFRDIAFNNGGVNLNLSAITGLSGDCGGNGMSGGGTLTLTASADQHWTNASGGNWSTNTNWTSRVPLPQDDVFFDNAFSASQTVTADMPRLGRDIDWTGATGSPTWGVNVNAVIMYGSPTLISAMTFTHTQTFTIESQARSGTAMLTTAGKAISLGGATVTIAVVDATLQLQDAVTGASSLNLTAGTLDANGNNVTANNYITSSSTTTLMNTGTWSLIQTNGTAWSMNASANVTPNTSIIALTGTGSNAKTFAGGGQDYNNLSITGGGSGAVNVTGSNTFNTFTINAPKTVTFTSATTQTIATPDFKGSNGNVVTLNSSTPGNAATLALRNGGMTSGNYLSITDINVTPSSAWYYGNNSTYTSGTGWSAISTRDAIVSDRNAMLRNR